MRLDEVKNLDDLRNLAMELVEEQDSLDAALEMHECFHASDKAGIGGIARYIAKAVHLAEQAAGDYGGLPDNELTDNFRQHLGKNDATIYDVLQHIYADAGIRQESFYFNDLGRQVAVFVPEGFFYKVEKPESSVIGFDGENSVAHMVLANQRVIVSDHQENGYKLSDGITLYPNEHRLISCTGKHNVDGMPVMDVSKDFWLGTNVLLDIRKYHASIPEKPKAVMPENCMW